jgi:hypothetical protein
LTGYYNTFVVRIWQEEPGGVLRGYLRHTATQEEVYFTSIEEMKTFVLKYLGQPADSPNGFLADKK